VVAIGANALSFKSADARKRFDSLAESLTFLKRVGLLPVVVHGDLDLEPEGVDSNPDDQSNILRRIRTLNYRFSAALDRNDVDARPITCGVFAATPEEGHPQRPYHGVVSAITPDAVESAIRAGSVPVVAALGMSSPCRSHALDVNHAAMHLARVLQPLRSVFLLPEERLSEVEEKNAADLSAIRALSNDLDDGASVLIGSATSLSHAIFPDSEPWRVMRKSRVIRVVTAVDQFPDGPALRAALQRHFQGEMNIDVDAFIAQLEQRDFVAYVDVTNDTIENLAIVFPGASFPWSAHGTSDIVTPPWRVNISELAVFAIDQTGWMNGVAEQFWERIRADHATVWGWLGDSDRRLPWWLARSGGSLRRVQEGRIYLWYGVVA
jgi:hypothetical protein